MALFDLDDIVILAVTEDDREMAAGIAATVPAPLLNLEITWFGDQEKELGCPEVRIPKSIRGKYVVIVSTIAGDVCKKTSLLQYAVRAAHDSHAERILVVTPYNAWSRSDKKDKSGVSYGFKLFADMMIWAGAYSVLVCDPHNDSTSGMLPRADSITAKYILAGVARGLGIEAMAMTDVGGRKRTEWMADALGVSYGLAGKSRKGKKDQVHVSGILGEDFVDKNVLLFDDEIATGGTIREEADELFRLGAKSVTAICTHLVLRGDVMEKMWGKDKLPIKVIGTNTVPLPQDKQWLVDAGVLEVIDISGMFGEVIRNIVLNISLNEFHNFRDDV